MRIPVFGLCGMIVIDSHSSRHSLLGHVGEMAPFQLVVFILAPTAVADATSVDVPNSTRNGGQHPFAVFLQIHIVVVSGHELTDVEIRILLRVGVLQTAVVAIGCVGIIQDSLLLRKEIVQVIITQEAAVASVSVITCRCITINIQRIVILSQLGSGVGEALRASRGERAAHSEEAV